MIVRISDITNNQTAYSTVPYGPYSPGISTSVSGGDAKRWLVQSSLDPSGWHGPGPACAITNSVGQIVASFVEIDGVVVGDWSYEDCRTNYNAVNGGGTMPQAFCDSDGDLYDPAQVPNPSTACTNNTDPTCWGIIHVEFDGDWLAARMCGPSTNYCNNNTLVSSTVRFSTSSLVDVQGFVYWDNEHTCAGTPSGCQDQWHSYNGWELHPLTAWRPHQSSTSPSVSFTYSPSSPNANTTIIFTANGNGGLSPYAYTWDFGDGATSDGSSQTHSYNTANTYRVMVTLTDSNGLTATSFQELSVSSQPSPTPLFVSFSYNSGPLVEGSKVMFSASATGGTGPYSYSWTFGDGTGGTGASTGHTYLRSGNYTVTLTTTDQAGKASVESEQLSITPSSTPPGQPPSGGICLTCIAPTGVSTSLWLLVVAGLTGIVSSIALYTLKARAELTAARRRMRLHQIRD